MTVIISILINVVLEATHGSRSIILPAFALYIITFSFCKLTYERAVGFIPGRFGVLQTEEFSHWRLFFFFFNEIKKTAERQCSFLPLREQGFDSNISEQMFRRSPNVFIWWHKDSVIHEMVC